MIGGVVQVNDKISLSGGVEVYISQVQPLLRSEGWESHWVGIGRKGRRVVVESDEPDLRWEGEASEIGSCPAAMWVKAKNGVFHVHSISDPELIDVLFSIAPVVRTMHEPRLFCPGQGKFWYRSETPCTHPMGLHCLAHAYTEGCCNRHPKRLIPAYRNTRFEIGYASKKYARIIANSQYVADEAVRAGISSEQVTLLHYFTPWVEVSQDMAGNIPEIVFAGRLARSKGVHHLLRAFSRTLQAIPDAYLNILGDGIDRVQFEQLAEKLEVVQNLTFHGWADRETVDRYFYSADVVAFPSVYPEAFGIVGIEAMIRGKPVVAYDVGGVKDWLSDGINGICVPLKDVERFSEALIAILSDPKCAKNYGRNGRARALKEFNSQDHVRELAKIYKEALDSR